MPAMHAVPSASTDLAQAVRQLDAAVQQLAVAVEQLQTQAGTGASLCGGGGPGPVADAIAGAAAGPDPVPAPAPTASTQVVDAPAEASTLGEQMVAEARAHLGKPYVFGAAGPSSFDCSGLILAVARKFGINLPHKASIQATAGTAVGREQLQSGDLVYFQGEGKSEVSHIGMYVGGGQYIHAPRPGDVVKISNLADAHATYRGARRLG